MRAVTAGRRHRSQAHHGTWTGQPKDPDEWRSHARTVHLHRHQPAQGRQIRCRTAAGAGAGAFVEAHEPRLIAFNEYVNEDHSQVSVVQFHPDAASMEFHMGVVGDHARQAYAQTLETTTGIQVFGTPTGNILRMLQQQAGSGVPLSIHPLHLGGFTRALEG